MSVEPAFDNALRLHQLGRLDEAEQAYREVLQIEPAHPGAQHLLGVIRHQRGDHETAVELIGRAIAINPTKAVYRNNYGAALLSLERYEEALACFHRALEIRPRYVDALSNLGMAEAALGHDEAAMACYRHALELEPQHYDAMTKLASLLHRLGRTAEAIGLWKKIIETNPRDGNVHFNLGTAYQELHQIDEAKAHFSQAVELCPDKPFWRFRSAMCCPPVFSSVEELNGYREGLSRAMGALAGGERPTASWNEIMVAGVYPWISLAYHDRDNRQLKEQFAAIYEPFFADQPTPPGSGRRDRRRIGFVVTHRHEGLFLHCMRGILEHLDRERFEPVVLCSQESVTTLRNGFRRGDLRLVAFRPSLPDTVRCIREVACDLIYYWEVGTDPMNYLLPFARLAPVQCTSWASVITTGVPAVDYFFSSELIEPAGSEAQYTERLWKSRSLFMHEGRLGAVPPATPGHFGLPEDRNLYVCFQNPLKLHPDIDSLLGEILAADPKGVVVLAGRQEWVAEQLRNRFEARIPWAADRIVFLSWLSREDYCKLLQLADVILDPIHYGGGSSCHDVFSYNQPMVTMPGRFINGRVAYGYYQKMQVEDLIARSPEEYVGKAVLVATDRDYREFVKERIAQASPAIFDDLEAVREYERFFESVLAKANRQ